MKYLFINSVLGYGSTGKLIESTCRKLISEGHECLVAWGRKKTGCDDIPNYRIGLAGQLYLNIISARIFDNDGFLATKQTKLFIKRLEAFSPDIVCLNNLHGYYLDMSVLFSYLAAHPNIRVEWTLHDCWALTGHCAYFDYVGCKKWRVKCSRCPQKNAYPKSLCFDRSERNFSRKKELYSSLTNIHVITPSDWLKKKAELGLLSGFEIEVKNNQVDTSIFRPLTKASQNSYLNEKLGGGYMGFSDSTWCSQYLGSPKGNGRYFLVSKYAS